MNNKREKEAIDAYLKLLQNKGASSGTLYKRSLFLDRLTAHLVKKALNRTNYGLALDQAIATVSQIDKYDCQNTAREFQEWFRCHDQPAGDDSGQDDQQERWQYAAGATLVEAR